MPPPLSNRGGRDSDSYCEAQEYERYEKYVIDYDGNIKAVPLRKGLGNSAFIDTLSFTFHESSVTGFCVDGKQVGISTPISDYDVIRNWSEISEFIFGFERVDFMDNDGKCRLMEFCMVKSILAVRMTPF